MIDERGTEMKKMNDLLRKMLLILIMICMIGTLGAVHTASAEGEEDTEDDGAETYEAITAMADNPPSDWYQTKDPYGYGEGNMFYLNQQQELLVYRYHGHEDQEIWSYDNLEKKNTGYPLSGVKNKDKDKYDVDKLYTLSHARTVAFDPTGSGRKDHIAVIGVYADDFKNDKTKAHIYLYVMDKDENYSPLRDLGKASWISDNHGANQDLNNDYMWDFNSMNFMGITAGDYDGDGKDSLVFWACGSDPVLQEVDVRSVNGSISFTNFGANAYKQRTGDWSDPKNDGTGLTHSLYVDSNDQVVENRLSVALGTGDFNGDGVDDLAVLSYVNRVTGFGSYNEQNKWGYYYIPMYSVSYGIKGDSTSITAGKNADKNIAVEDTWRGDTHVAPIAAGLATGDVDGDGRDEVVITGLYHEVSGDYWTGSGNRKQVKDAYKEVDKNTLVTAIYRGSSCLMFSKDMTSNKWTTGNEGSTGGYFTSGNGSYADQSYQQVSVETVAINGRKNAEMIFINGDLYTYGNGKLTCVYQPAYFQEVDGATGTTRINKETYMRSTAVGNFDGNEEGREQIVFVTAAALEAGVDPFYGSARTPHSATAISMKSRLPMS